MDATAKISLKKITLVEYNAIRKLRAWDSLGALPYFKDGIAKNARILQSGNYTSNVWVVLNLTS